MHNKFVVIDYEIVMTGSYNWTMHASSGNQENVIVLRSQVLVQRFTEQFNVLWKEYYEFKLSGIKKSPKKTALYLKLKKIITKKSSYLKKKEEQSNQAKPSGTKAPKRIKLNTVLASSSKKITKRSKIFTNSSLTRFRKVRNFTCTTYF